MARVRVLDKDAADATALTAVEDVRVTLAMVGVDYERWDLSRVSENAPAEEVLAAYRDEIDRMKQLGGYTTADVIDVTPETPGLDAMLARFDKEHTHSEDEVRFILSGRGIFFLHASDHRVISAEVAAGDWIRIPRGTRHWFTLCSERQIRAIRWFQQTSGWTPEYTGSGVDQGYEPLCFGPTFLGQRTPAAIAL